MNNIIMNSLRVINRNGDDEEISFDEIKNRISCLANFVKVGLIDKQLDNINASKIALDTITKLFDGITTRELDLESAKVCASLELVHYNYGLLGGRILSSDHHKNLIKLGLNTFSSRVKYINDNLENFYNKDFFEFIMNHKDDLDKIIDIERDYLINYFGFKTLERSYLLKVKEIIETPQDMFIRVAINIHYRSSIEYNEIIKLIKETYDMTSKGYYTHATPTLFNSGTIYEQMSSCYLLGTEDSLDKIFKTVSDAALISKWAGGIGIHISNIRANGSPINSSNGKSDGILPMLKVYNEVARYSNQNGKRKGSFAFYIEPWHADIESFIDLKKNTGAETERARDIFTALWIPDEFMRRVENNEDWYLMCPNLSPGLNEVYGDKFSELYYKYITDGKYIKKIQAKELLHKIMESQIETGVPYICFKDNINRKSNQSNIGIIKSSNLCAEIMEVSSSSEYAVCNLGSIAVNHFIKNSNIDYKIWLKYHDENKLTNKEKKELLEILKSVYDFNSLKEVSSKLTYNLNKIIDYNYYPVIETFKSNIKNRPIGIGIQGLGDLYYMLNISYSSFVAKYIDALIMETIYYGSIIESSNIAKQLNMSYQTFEGSSFSKGIFQFDLWELENKFNYKQYPQMYDWNEIKKNVKMMRNSLLTALMPTATTSQILGNNECFEPYSSNIYKRTTLAGEFQVVNKHLVKKLIEMNLWNENIRTSIISSDGSLKDINIDTEEFRYLKEVYKTIWEVKQKDVIDHSLARGPYVDQSQSMNLFFANPNFSSLYSALLYGWKNGIKTGCYYLRSKPVIEANKYALNIEKKEECTICSA
jgi:ribonucleoside-diphosphate reductase alpha chain